ncbi:MAG: hypothetical protein JWM56_295 [Candidatus Peribacteria bacterium]|nr:hypothetical protein [Candidatus Peribacteria bacterium]
MNTPKYLSRTSEAFILHKADIFQAQQLANRLGILRGKFAVLINDTGILCDDDGRYDSVSVKRSFFALAQPNRMSGLHTTIEQSAERNVGDVNRATTMLALLNQVAAIHLSIEQCMNTQENQVPQCKQKIQALNDACRELGIDSLFQFIFSRQAMMQALKRMETQYRYKEEKVIEVWTCVHELFPDDYMIVHGMCNFMLKNNQDAELVRAIIEEYAVAHGQLPEDVQGDAAAQKSAVMDHFFMVHLPLAVQYIDALVREGKYTDALHILELPWVRKHSEKDADLRALAKACAVGLRRPSDAT